MIDSAAHRAVSCAFVRSSGGFAVKVKPGSKAADKDWNPRANTVARSQQVLSQLVDSADNIALHFHGKLVDVDVDGDGCQDFLVPALDLFLPDCAHIWGRESRPCTHRSYIIAGDKDYNPLNYPVLRRLKKIPEVKVELRGGAKSRGEYTVLPGSVHPDGDEYIWDDLGKAAVTPTVAPLDDILKGIRFAGAVAVLAPHWQSGMRQELTLALSGFLYRASDLTQAIDPELFRVSKEDAMQLLEVLLELTEDDAKDFRMRREAFNKTWKKAANEGNVTGATRLAELTGDKDIVFKLYTLLSDSSEVAEIDEFVSRFVIWQGAAVAIDKKVLLAGGNQPFMTRHKFASSYGHMFVEVGKKRKLLPEMLWSMSAATRVIGLTFDPKGESIIQDREGDKLNQWSGFASPPWSEPVADEDVGIFLDYLMEVICSNQEDFYKWVLAWIADIIQQPGDKPGTALVLVGRSGVGKSFLGENILKRIIGSRHFSQSNSIDHIISSFNAAYSNQLLIQCDEALSARQRTAAARLKSLITDGMQRVEPKGVDAYFTPLHARFLFTSNEQEDAIHLDQGYDDRRYTVLEVPAIHQATPYNTELKDYWLPFVTWLEVDDNISRLHRYLLDHEYDRSLIRLPLQSAAKERMQQRSWDVIDGWLAAMLSRGHPLSESNHAHWFDAPQVSDGEEKLSRVIDRREWPKWISWTALEKDFLSYLRSLRTRTEPLNSIQLARALSERGIYDPDAADTMRVRAEYFDTRKDEQVLTRIRLKEFPGQKAIAEYLKDRHGFEAGTDNREIIMEAVNDTNMNNL